MAFRWSCVWPAPAGALAATGSPAAADELRARRTRRAASLRRRRRVDAPLATAHGTWRMGPRRSMPAHAPRRLARPVTCGCSARPACDPCVPPGTRAGPPCRFGGAGFLWTDDRALLGPQWRTQLAIRAGGRNATKDRPGASRTGPRCARGATEAPCRAAMTPVAASRKSARRSAACRKPGARHWRAIQSMGRADRGTSWEGASAVSWPGLRVPGCAPPSDVRHCVAGQPGSRSAACAPESSRSVAARPHAGACRACQNESW